MQREAYELALYAFKYVDGIDNVVAFLPPAPPRPRRPEGERASRNGAFPAGAQALADAEGKPLPAMLFLPGDVEASLKRPLDETFPAEPPRPGTISKTEVDTFNVFAQQHAFNASVVPDQTGAGFLVLDRMAQAALAQESLESTKKA